MSQYQVWQCRIYVAADAQLPAGFDAPPRSAAEMAIEAKGINVIANFSGWGEKPKECEAAVIENRLPNRDAIESSATAPLLERIKELERELEAVRKDAERYRWLRDVSVPPHNFYLSVPIEFDGIRYTQHEVDAAIDAAKDKQNETQQRKS